MNEAVVAVAAGVPSFLLGYLTYRRSVKVDKVAAQANVSSESRAGTAQIIEGLNSLVDQLQEDNKDLRDEAKYFVNRISEIIAECDAVKRQLREFQRKYGEEPV